jgi:hypothetical protein
MVCNIYSGQEKCILINFEVFGVMIDENFRELDFGAGPEADRYLDQVVRSVIFEGWDRARVNEFMQAVRATVRTYDPGTTIVEEGQEAFDMYMVLGGTVALPDLGIELNSPSVFGEAAVLPYSRNRIRNATVAAPELGPEGVVATELLHIVGGDVITLKNRSLNGCGMAADFYGGLAKVGHARLADMNLAYSAQLETNEGLRRELAQYKGK